MILSIRIIIIIEIKKVFPGQMPENTSGLRRIRRSHFTTFDSAPRWYCSLISRNTLLRSFRILLFRKLTSGLRRIRTFHPCVISTVLCQLSYEPNTGCLQKYSIVGFVRNFVNVLLVRFPRFFLAALLSV